MSGFGDFDIDGVFTDPSVMTAGGFVTDNLDPSQGLIVVGVNGIDTGLGVIGLPNFQGPAEFGSGGLIDPTIGSGDSFGVLFPNTATIFLPFDYVSGSPLSGESFYEGETIASLGLQPGIFEWTWTTATGTDSVTLTVVPEPTIPLSLFSFFTVCLFSRRRSRIVR